MPGHEHLRLGADVVARHPAPTIEHEANYRRPVVRIVYEGHYPVVTAGMRSILCEAGIEVRSRAKASAEPSSSSSSVDANVALFICNGTQERLEADILRYSNRDIGVVVLDCDPHAAVAVPSLASGALSYV